MLDEDCIYCISIFHNSNKLFSRIFYGIGGFKLYFLSCCKFTVFLGIFFHLKSSLIPENSKEIQDSGMNMLLNLLALNFAMPLGYKLVKKKLSLIYKITSPPLCLGLL